MSSIRKSAIWAKEDSFGKGNSDGKTNKWYHVPPGFFMSHQHNRSTNRVEATGTKRYDFVAYGKVGGNWDASFNIDYDYLEFLKFVFDEIAEDETAKDLPTGCHRFTVRKSDYGRVPSFVVRFVQLNQFAGGTWDEVTEVRGCVCTQVTFAQSAGSSQWHVSMSGFCTRYVTWLGKLGKTDYDSNKGLIAQFACLFKGDTPVKNDYIANCESIQVNIASTLETIDSTCTPYSPSYYEGKTVYNFTTAVYSNDPTLFKQRLMLGGQSVENYKTKNDDYPPGTEYIDGSSDNDRYVVQDVCKKLAPMPAMCIATYDACCNDKAISSSSTDRIADAVAVSKNRMQFNMTNLVIKSMSWQRGDGSKITDSISSVECQDINMALVLPREAVDNKDKVADPVAGIMFDNSGYKWLYGEWKKGEFTQNRFTLTVKYTGYTEAIPDHVEVVKTGDKYSVTSPVKEGYTADKTIVEGTMPANDLTVTVTYSKNP